MRKRRLEIEEDLLYLESALNYCDLAERKLALVDFGNFDFREETLLEGVVLNLGQIGEQFDRQKLSYETYIMFKKYLNLSEIKESRQECYHHYGSLDVQAIVDFVLIDVPEWKKKIIYMQNYLEAELHGESG